jgi:hypothetical protein
VPDCSIRSLLVSAGSTGAQRRSRLRKCADSVIADLVECRLTSVEAGSDQCCSWCRYLVCLPRGSHTRELSRDWSSITCDGGLVRNEVKDMANASGYTSRLCTLLDSRACVREEYPKVKMLRKGGVAMGRRTRACCAHIATTCRAR